MTNKKVSMSFVARIWLEAATNGDPIWRGHVRHVQSKEETYFQDLMQMSEFLAQVSRVAGPALSLQPSENGTDTDAGTITTIKRKD